MLFWKNLAQTFAHLSATSLERTARHAHAPDVQDVAVDPQIALGIDAQRALDVHEVGPELGHELLHVRRR